MSVRWYQTIVGVALAGVIALAFVYPHQMVGPGKLIPAHRNLEGDCFACHAPFQGASPDRCTKCHAVADIGRRTTAGTPIVRATPRPAFHQALTQKNCLACHSDHPPPALTRQRATRFDHALLETAFRARCQTCHAAPADALHREAKECSQCHRAAGWTPATFDHRRFFPLDADHNVACTTCHTAGDYRQYTCYGCHEHERSRMIAVHREEGVRNIETCARCHTAKTWRGESENQQGRDDD